jgi:hypothetical protein
MLAPAVPVANAALLFALVTFGGSVLGGPAAAGMDMIPREHPVLGPGQLGPGARHRGSRPWTNVVQAIRVVARVHTSAIRVMMGVDRISAAGHRDRRR